MAKHRSRSHPSKHLRILGFGSSRSGERFVQIQIRSNGNKQTFLLRIDDWGTHKFAELNRRGAHLIDDGSRRAFTTQLQGSAPPRETFKVATQIGWHEKLFVLPGRKLGSKARLEVHLEGQDPALVAKYRKGGSLKGWRELGRLARGNSRFMLALALSFVGPLGAILAVEQPSIQLVGEPGSGKTTIAVAAGSVWGRHTNPERALKLGFGESWNQTVNHTEPAAALHNHTLLILDETRTGGAFEGMLQAIMRLEGSVEKGRLNAAPSRSWWVPILSTSNRSLDELAADAGVLLDDAYRGRLIDVPNPVGGYGAFQDLHGSADHVAFAQRILGIAAANFGRAGRHFVERLEKDRDEDDQALRKRLQRRRSYFLRRARRLMTNGRELGRILEKFATIYAAGRLACDYRLLRWKHSELREALLACLQAHIDMVAGQGGGSSAALPTPMERLRSYVADHRSEFVDLRKGLVSDPDHDHAACLGYVFEHGGEREYLLSDPRFQEVAGSQRAAKQLKKDLNRAQAIRSAGGGKDGDRFAVKVPISDTKGEKKRRRYVVAVKAEALDP